jgi:hypothetical protein
MAKLCSTFLSRLNDHERSERLDSVVFLDLPSRDKEGWGLKHLS